MQTTRPTAMEAGHITYSEVLAWSTLLGLNITAFEVRCLMVLDTEFMKCRREEAAAKKASQPASN